jgi:hypothetical protein
MTKITESLSYKDLEDLVENVFTIDVFKSKAFDDETVITMSFTVKGELPAEDLEKFLEKGYKVLDCEKEISSDGEDMYSVFLELKREPETLDHIDDLLSDIFNLVEFDNWKFKYYKDEKTHPYSKELLGQMVPFTTDAYNDKIEVEKAETVNEFIGRDLLDKISLNEDVVTFFKGPIKLRYRITETDVDYTKIDLSSEALRECNQLDNFLLRSILIHKADGHLILTKNNRRLFLKSI